MLLQSSGVAQLLDGDVYRPFTLLLPTDGAMAALPKEQRDFLLHRDQRPQLVEYLKYHVLPGQKVGPPARTLTLQYGRPAIHFKVVHISNVVHQRVPYSM